MIRVEFVNHQGSVEVSAETRQAASLQGSRELKFRQFLHCAEQVAGLGQDGIL